MHHVRYVLDVMTAFLRSAFFLASCVLNTVYEAGTGLLKS